MRMRRRYKRKEEAKACGRRTTDFALTRRDEDGVRHWRKVPCPRYLGAFSEAI
jgi:hypothetical protein